MKRKSLNLVHVLFIICICQQLSAQTEKGKLLLSGTTGFSSLTVNNTYSSNYPNPAKAKVTSFQVTPEIGYFLANNLVLGIAVTYKSDKSVEGYQTFSSSSLYVLPVLQLYFGKEKLKPYIYGGVGIGQAHDSENGYGTSFSNFDKKLVISEIGLGLAFFVNTHVSIDFDVAFSNITSKYTDIIERIDKSQGTGFGIGVVLYL